MDDLFGLVGRRLADKYLIQAVVAKGGFGLVYRARHATLNKSLAVKVLMVPDDLSDTARAEFMRMFLQEAEMIAQLDHPAIVRVLDSGVARMPTGEDAPWMVLDWIEGETLDAHLKARRGTRGRAPQEALAMLRPVFEALAYAHDQGLAHRDIKPANIMLTVAAPGPRVSRHGLVGIRLLDFGIAKIMEPEEQAGAGRTRTRSKHMAFSPLYAAPEQIGGARTGPWTDVHALGLILTEVLTDQPAFTARDQTELFGQVLSPLRPTPASKGMDVGAWEPVIARALALRPAERFPTSGDLLSALETALGGAKAQPVAPFPETRRSTPVPVPPMFAPVASAPVLPPTFVPALAPTVLPDHGSTVRSPTSTSTLRPAEIPGSVRPRRPLRAVVVTAGVVGALLAAIAVVGYAVRPGSHGDTRPATAGVAPVTAVPTPAAVPSAPPSAPVVAVALPTPVAAPQAPAAAPVVQAPASPVAMPLVVAAPRGVVPAATQGGRQVRGHRRRRPGEDPLAEPMVSAAPGFPPAPPPPSQSGTRLGAGDM